MADTVRARLGAEGAEERVMIGRETAEEGAQLISSAIAELSEDASAEAVCMEKDGQTVWVMRAERLEAMGLDLTALARALGVLARRSEARGQGSAHPTADTESGT